MSSAMIMLGVTVKLFDQMSGGLRNISGQVGGLTGKFKALSDSASAFGRASLANGLIAGGATLKTVGAYAELEDASTRLKVTMMDKSGLTGAFEQVNALAVKLGNQLPGTSADFLNMMATLKQFGLSDESILGGVGEATAKIAVLLKQTPEAAAEFASKLKAATGVADKDMLAFMDTMQRVYHQGVSNTEMMYAFARSAGALKQMRIQGLGASKDMSALYAILIKTGMSGETAGTGTAGVLNTLMDAKKLREVNGLLQQKGFQSLSFTDKKGNFLGVENMVAQFEKLKALNPAQLSFILKKMFGGGQDQAIVATLVNNGLEGYKKMVADMEQQASLQKRVGEQLGTLRNLWDAASGTFTNTLAAFAGAMGPELKALAGMFGELAEWLGKLIKQFPTASKWLGLIALGFSGLAIVGGGAALALAGVAAGMPLLISGLLAGAGALATLMTGLSVVGAFLLANPLVLAFTLLALAAYGIYEHWAPIKEFFVDLWEGVKNTFAQAVEWVGVKMQVLSDLMPNWMKKYTLPGAAVQFMGEKLGPARPAATAQPGQANVSGQITVRLDQDGRVKSVLAKSGNADVPLNVDSGLTMVAP